MTTYATAQAQPYQEMGIPLYRLRRYRDTDEGYITVTWTADVARGPSLKGIPYGHAFLLVRPHVVAALRSLRHMLAVVVPGDAHEPICAFSLLDTSTDIPVLHHLHVKGSFRGQGIMTDLLAMQGVARGQSLIAASDTRDLRRVRARRLYDIHIRPELLLGHLNVGI